jgi:predicted dehydrogenase
MDEMEIEKSHISCAICEIFPRNAFLHFPLSLDTYLSVGLTSNGSLHSAKFKREREISLIMFDRRAFLQNAAKAATISAATTHLHLLLAQSPAPAPRSPNDTIQLALIGAGIQGQGDTRTALQVPGVKLVAVADCYDGRLAHAKELWGSDLFTSRDYREVLSRKDVDAVLIATPDHWHKQAAVDALHAGKDVYLEKPMIHLYSDGPEIIDAARSTNRILQVGSQRVSSIVYAKAKELLAAGAIGKLNMVTARWDRNSSLGAWNYSIPPDASTSTCDWPRFLGSAPNIPFSAERFFQWRKWKDYGSGVAGDLFVHLFSGTHFITGANGPTRAMATGGLRFWNDGRDVYDVLLALFDYPEGFNLSLRVNFVDGGEESEGFLFTGSEGLMEIAGNTVTVTRTPLATEPGYTVSTFTDAMQKEYVEQYRKKYPIKHPEGPPVQEVEKFVAPNGYSDSYDHFHNFFNSVRSRQPVVEDAIFGFRAAGAALLSNLSVERGSVVHWNPETMKLT